MVTNVTLNRPSGMKRYDQQVHMWSALPFVDKYLRFQGNVPAMVNQGLLPKKQIPPRRTPMTRIYKCNVPYFLIVISAIRVISSKGLLLKFVFAVSPLELQQSKTARD